MSNINKNLKKKATKKAKAANKQLRSAMKRVKL